MTARAWRAAGARLAALALLGAAAGCASLQGDSRPPERIEHYEAVLGGAQEVPAVTTAATGRAQLDYHPRSSMLHWRVESSGLSGKATAAHIHGPAGPGQNAPAIVPLNVAASPISGQLRITPEQATQLESGQWYVNVHTAAHPEGEIRGQLRSRPD